MGNGTVFEVDQAGRETVLYSFCSASGCAYGAYPSAGLIADAAGNFYGITSLGGANAYYDDRLQRYVGGTMLELRPPAQAGGAWTETVLYSFCAAPNCADGFSPNGPLIADAGNLYGTTPYGGTDRGCCGTAFKLATGKRLSFAISSGRESLSLPAGKSGTLTIAVTPSTGFFNGPISFSCGVRRTAFHAVLVRPRRLPTELR